MTLESLYHHLRVLIWGGTCIISFLSSFLDIWYTVGSFGEQDLRLFLFLHSLTFRRFRHSFDLPRVQVWRAAELEVCRNCSMLTAMSVVDTPLWSTPQYHTTHHHHNISTTIRWIALKFSTDIYGSIWLQVTKDKIFTYLVKYLNIFLIILSRHLWFPDNESYYFGDPPAFPVAWSWHLWF